MPAGRPKKNIDIKTLVSDYLSGMSLIDLAGKYGVSDMTILDRLKSTGIPSRPAHRRLKRENKVRMKDPLNNKEFVDQVTTYQKGCGFNEYEISRRMQVSIKDVMKVTRRKNDTD